jgi:bifunctional non-homologous end joining protein LigD
MATKRETSRATDDVLDFLPADARRHLRRRSQPSWCSPMLATLTREPFSNPDWIFETKLDGIRCLAFRKGNSLELYSRNHLSLNRAFPAIADALIQQGVRDFVLDGEVVAFERGVTRFEVLQQRMRKHVPVSYYVFDILHLNGYDLTAVELRHRKEILRRALTFQDPIGYSEHRDAKGEVYYREACRKGWEGVIAKRAASPYVHQRSGDWLKFKCENAQEFVIIGYTDPMGERTGIGALLVGVYERGKLRYAGKVGTGFDNETLRTLEQKLSAIEVKAAPVADDSLPRTKVHWVRPRYVAQVGFTEWTTAGKLRHPRYLGLRNDKKASEVVRERA